MVKGDKPYRGIIENLYSSIAVVDYTGAFLFLNEHGAKQLGWPSGGYVGKTLWDAFPQEVADHHIEFVRRVITTGQGEVVETVTVLQAEPGWYQASLQPFRSEDGKITAALVFTSDIDNLKTTQEKLTRALSWQEAIFEGSRDAIFISNSETRIIAVNGAGFELTGLGKEELLQKRIWELYPADQQKACQKAFDHIMNGGPCTIEAKFQKHDGTIVHMEFVNHRIEIDRQYFIHTAGRDITRQKNAELALRESEERYRLMISSMADYVLGFDEEGRFVLYHTPTGKAINLGPEKTLGRKAPEVLPPHLGELFRVSFEKNKRKESSDFEFWLETGGETRWFSGKMAPIFLDDVFKGSVAVLRDITERKRAIAEQNENQEKMARAEQLASVGLLGATFAHQMNQPLTAIRLFLQQSIRALKKQLNPRQVIQNLDDSLSEVTKAIAVTSQFLQFSRRVNQEKPIEVDVGDVAKRISSLLSESARRVKMELIIDSLEKLPKIEGHLGDIEQMFFILIQNAIQAAEGRNGSQLRIRGVLKNEAIELEFSDTCGGIAAENQDKIFQPFFTTKPPGLGTGLGLCILQRIVSKHSGKVRLENRIGEGVTFFILLPIFN